MNRYEGLNEPEYRKASYFDGNDIKYSIEKKKGNKWVFCFGGLDYKEATDLLNKPTEIESQMKSFRITGYCVLVFLIISALYFIFNKNS